MPTPRRGAGAAPVTVSGGALRTGRRRLPGRPGTVPPLPAPVTALDTGSDGAAAAAGTVSKLIETAVPSYLSIEVRFHSAHQ